MTSSQISVTPEMHLTKIHQPSERNARPLPVPENKILFPDDGIFFLFDPFLKVFDQVIEHALLLKRRTKNLQQAKLWFMIPSRAQIRNLLTQAILLSKIRKHQIMVVRKSKILLRF